MPAAIDELLEIVQDREAVPSPLSFVKPFFGRRRNWPPQKFSTEHYGRRWEVQEFRHDPAIRSNFYQTIELKGEGPGLDNRAQVFHFAYHQLHLFGARWLQYGSVVRHDRTAFLWHINGHTEERKMRTLDEPVLVETWFGPAPVDFKVASLHAFNLIIPAAQSSEQKPMRFPV